MLGRSGSAELAVSGAGGGGRSAGGNAAPREPMTAPTPRSGRSTSGKFSSFGVALLIARMIRRG